MCVRWVSCRKTMSARRRSNSLNKLCRLPGACSPRTLSENKVSLAIGTNRGNPLLILSEPIPSEADSKEEGERKGGVELENAKRNKRIKRRYIIKHFQHNQHPLCRWLHARKKLQCIIGINRGSRTPRRLTPVGAGA